MYLAHRTEGVIQRRATAGAAAAALVMVLAFIGAGVWLRYGGIEGFVITSVIDPNGLADPMAKTVARSADGWWLNYAKAPLLWLLPALGIAGALLAALLVRARQTLSAFVASSLAIVGVIGTAGAAMFPFVMPSSSMPNASLTVWDAVSSHLTLGLMFWSPSHRSRPMTTRRTDTMVSLSIPRADSRAPASDTDAGGPPCAVTRCSNKE
jgi:cytochrome bd ubiquinol oxidase subunit II